MSGLLVSLQGAVAQGVLWGIMVLGVYITFRLMDIADMTVDGSFALGACVCAVLVVNKGVNPVLALLVAAAAGVVAGAEVAQSRFSVGGLFQVWIQESGGVEDLFYFGVELKP